MSGQTGPGPRSLTLAEVAAIVDGRVVGDAAVRVTGVAPVDEAGRTELGFLGLPRYVRHVAASGAGALLVAVELEGALGPGWSAVVVDEAYPALRSILDHFHPIGPRPRGVHDTAVVADGVEIGEDAHVGPYAVLEAGVRIGAHASVGAHCVVGRGSTIGPRSVLHPHVVVYHGTRIGSDVIVHAGACIGSDGFGYTFVDGAHRKMPQVGRAVIEDDVEIGANTTVDRGSLGDTVVGKGSKIDNLVQVAHNVKVGSLSLMAALVGIAGSTRIGQRVWLGGQAGVINQLEVGDGARIAVGSLVMRDVPAGETVSGMPARPHRAEMRKQARLSRLEKLVERVRDLEEEVERLRELP